MAYLRVSEVRAAAATSPELRFKTAERLLIEEAGTFSTAKSYDIFLSHSYNDAQLIFLIKRMIEGMGLKVYVDWIDDAKLDRSKVTVKTAALLRERMKACASLVYAHSTNSTDSVWMPWELGYFDGLRGSHVWILPLVSNSDQEYKKQEYLGLYPSIETVSNLYGRQDLGFTNVGDNNRQVTLAEASNSVGGIFLRS
jgi:hypothetical protein